MKKEQVILELDAFLTIIWIVLLLLLGAALILAVIQGYRLYLLAQRKRTCDQLEKSCRSLYGTCMQSIGRIEELRSRRADYLDGKGTSQGLRTMQQRLPEELCQLLGIQTGMADSHAQEDHYAGKDNSVEEELRIAAERIEHGAMAMLLLQDRCPVIPGKLWRKGKELKKLCARMKRICDEGQWILADMEDGRNVLQRKYKRLEEDLEDLQISYHELADVMQKEIPCTLIISRIERVTGQATKSALDLGRRNIRGPYSLDELGLFGSERAHTMEEALGHLGIYVMGWQDPKSGEDGLKLLCGKEFLVKGEGMSGGAVTQAILKKGKTYTLTVSSPFYGQVSMEARLK